MKKISKTLLSLIVIFSITFGTICVPVYADWQQNSSGWWYNKGNSYSIGWDKIDGNWYYFKYNGYMKTGWIKYNDTWYFLGSSGALDDSKTTKVMPIQYTYEQCEQIASAYFSNSHQSGYKFKIVSDKKLYDDGKYIFSIYSISGNQQLDYFAVNSVTGEITE